MMVTSVASSTIQVRSLATQPYAATRDAMIAFTRTRDEAVATAFFDHPETIPDAVAAVTTPSTTASFP